MYSFVSAINMLNAANIVVLGCCLIATASARLAVFRDVCEDILVEQKVDESSFFNRTWNEFREGFGDTDGNYWLGNEQLHALTQDGKYKLRLELEGRKTGPWQAEYDTFIVGDESTQYTLTVDGFHGSVGYDTLAYHNGMKFSTKDRDNDMYTYRNGNCAKFLGGGFWYNVCANCLLTGAGHNFKCSFMSRDTEDNLTLSRMTLVCL